MVRNAPSPWVERFKSLVPSGGAVLDLACGSGRHGRLFLELGHGVTFVDRDMAGISDLAGTPQAELVTADLEAVPWPLAGCAFAGIVVTNYLYRPLFPHILAALAPGGITKVGLFVDANDAEIDAVAAKIVAAVESATGAGLRR